MAHSIRQGAPIIYVAMNYRLHVSAPSSCLYHFHCHLNPYSCLFHRTGFWIPRWKTGLRWWCYKPWTERYQISSQMGPGTRALLIICYVSLYLNHTANLIINTINPFNPSSVLSLHYRNTLSNLEVTQQRWPSLENQVCNPISSLPHYQFPKTLIPLPLFIFYFIFIYLSNQAGAIIVSHHMTAQNGQNDGLFRAAICQSGTALPTTRS